MKSVKGLTWGTPEFIEIAKRGEREGEVAELIERLDEINFDVLYNESPNAMQSESLRDIRYTINDVLGEYACYGECDEE